MSKVRSGGGITSNKLVRPGYRSGMPKQKVNVGAVSQIGSALGNHAQEEGQKVLKSAEPLYGGEGYQSTPLGNELTKNVGKGGPGAGRVVHARGSQQAPTTREMPRGRDTLAEFGPDVPGRRR